MTAVLELSPRTGLAPLCLADELPDLGRQLSRTIETVEPGFMRICQSLQELSIDIGRLRQSTSTAATLVAPENQDNSINRVLAAVERALAELDRDRADIGRGLQGLERMMAEMAGLKQTQADFKRLVRRLRIIGLNMSMESVYLKDSRADFEVFSREIYRLSERIGQVADLFYEDIGQSRTIQEQAYGAMSRGAATLGPLVEQGQQQVRQVLDQVARLTEQALQNMTRAAQLFEAINKNIQEIVMGVQFHDITRQQLEHVVETLAELQAVAPDDGPDQDSQWGLAYIGLTMQGAQLEQAAQTIGRVWTEMSGALGNMGESIRSLDSVVPSGQADDSRQESFTRLVRDLDAFTGLLRQSSALRGQIHQTARQLAGLSDKMRVHTESISEIRIDLDLKSINAMILSDHLGTAGRTQEVLAQEVYQVSHDMEELAKGIGARLNRVIEASDEIGGLSGGPTVGQAEAVGAMELDLQEQLDQLSKTHEQFVQAEGAIACGVAELTGRIESVCRTLVFLEELQGCLSQQGGAVQALARPLAGYAGAVTDQQRAELEQVSRRYTMENERIVHQLCLGGPGGSAGTACPAAAPARSGGGADDLGDNIELF